MIGQFLHQTDISKRIFKALLWLAFPCCCSQHVSVTRRTRAPHLCIIITLNLVFHFVWWLEYKFWQWCKGGELSRLIAVVLLNCDTVFQDYNINLSIHGMQNSLWVLSAGNQTETCFSLNRTKATTFLFIFRWSSSRKRPTYSLLWFSIFGNQVKYPPRRALSR